jgi:hypothetical protein
MVQGIIGYRIGLLVKRLIRLPVTQKNTGSIPVQVANLVYVKDSEFNVTITVILDAYLIGANKGIA